MSTYFITGATGVVGSALVPLLLVDGHHVRLLVRGDDDADVAHRLDGLFRFWQFGDAEARQARQRVQALRGDASLPCFGLPAQAYHDVVATTQRIVHSAGAVRMNLPIADARLSAVGSATQIVALARACQRHGQLEKLDVVSTVGVGGRLDQVPEQWITTPRQFHNTYEQAKAEAEDLLHAESEGGLPLTVHRPSMVVGHSRTGAIMGFQVFYHLCEFLAGRRTLGLFPPLGDGSLDIVPVDHVAAVLAWSSGQPSLAGQVLHTCAGPAGALRLTELRTRARQAMRAHGVWVPPQIDLSARRFAQLLGLAAPLLGQRGRRAVSTLPVFLDYLATRQQFDNTRTSALLAQAAGITQPDWQTYLPRVLQAYLARDAARAGR